MKNKIKAFTLLELVVSMALVAIIVSIAYTALFIVSSTFINFEKNNDKVYTLDALDAVMRNDFRKSNHISASKESLRFIFENDTITYAFNDSAVTRTSHHVERFKIPVSNPRLNFNGHEITMGEGPQDYQTIDELSFTSVSGAYEIPLHFKKHYSSQELFFN